MDTQLFARRCRTIDESDSNRVWVHPSVAKYSSHCVAFFNGKQSTFAVGIDHTIDPTHFHLSVASRKYLTCDYENARVYFKDCDIVYTPEEETLVLDLQIANIDKESMNKTYDADQMRCEMMCMFAGTTFQADRPLTFMHRNVMFHVTPQSDFVYCDEYHKMQLTHAANTCFNLSCCEGSTAIAANTPYLSKADMY